MNQIHY